MRAVSRRTCISQTVILFIDGRFRTGGWSRWMMSPFTWPRSSMSSSESWSSIAKAAQTNTFATSRRCVGSPESSFARMCSKGGSAPKDWKQPGCRSRGLSSGRVAVARPIAPRLSAWVEAVGIENRGFRCESGNCGKSQETGSRGIGIKTRGKALSGNRFARWQNRARVGAGKGGRGRRAHRRDFGNVGPQRLVELPACRVARAGTGCPAVTGRFQEATLMQD